MPSYRLRSTRSNSAPFSWVIERRATGALMQVFSNQQSWKSREFWPKISVLLLQWSGASTVWLATIISAVHAAICFSSYFLPAFVKVTKLGIASLTCKMFAGFYGDCCQWFATGYFVWQCTVRSAPPWQCVGMFVLPQPRKGSCEGKKRGKSRGCCTTGTAPCGVRSENVSRESGIAEYPSCFVRSALP